MKNDQIFKYICECLSIYLVDKLRNEERGDGTAEESHVGVYDRAVARVLRHIGGVERRPEHPEKGGTYKVSLV